MTSSASHEIARLATCNTAIAFFVSSKRSGLREPWRLSLLEALAARCGGFDIGWYWSEYGEPPSAPSHDFWKCVDQLEVLVSGMRQHASLALATLAQPNVQLAVAKSQGIYYTDSRLAAYAARVFQARPHALQHVIDPACGSGVLLASTALSACGLDRRKIDRFIANVVCGADISPSAIRGASLALASFVSSRSVISRLRGRLRVTDSLLAPPSFWRDVADAGFSAVITNPPWEKLRLLKHEYLARDGTIFAYGSAIDKGVLNPERLEVERAKLRSYAAQLQSGLKLQSRGEKDLYIYFIERSLSLLGKGGTLVAIVPGGLIRSQGTAAARHQIFAGSPDVRISVFSNHARFFPIDSRFKFVILQVQHWGKYRKTRPIQLTHPICSADDVEEGISVALDRRRLTIARPDLTIPEVRNHQEWRLFESLALRHEKFGETGGTWLPRFHRELDMTADRQLFSRRRLSNGVALVEGRMVHQFRSNAKRYVSGSGRSARWDPVQMGITTYHPQYCVRSSSLPHTVRRLTMRHRVGFCDITGQTNERTMLASLIPNGVVCGNKVPTITFESDDQEQLYGWLAIANSLTFDWLVRRLSTTTMNFFIVRSVPVPQYHRGSLPWMYLERLVQHHMRTSKRLGYSWQLAQVRAEMDSRVARLYSIDPTRLAIIMNDFPLLDRGQPAIAGEAGSSVTRDLVLLTHLKNFHASEAAEIHCLQQRVDAARSAGAIPYVPSEFTPSNRLIAQVSASHSS